MSKSPQFPFYVNNWIGGTMRFSPAEKGAYIDLLCLQFNGGPFTIEEGREYLGEKYWDSTWRKVQTKFSFNGEQRLFNMRLAVEMEKQKRASQAGKAGADKRWNRTLSKPHSESHSESHMPSGMPNGMPKASLDIDIDIDTKNDNNIDLRREKFKKSIFDLVGKKIGKEDAMNFYLYWGQELQGKKKMRFEGEKTWNLNMRISTWIRNKKHYNLNEPKGKRGEGPIAPGAEKIGK